MDNDLELALLITLVGMSLVFALIILISIFMYFLVRLTSKPEAKPQPKAESVTDELKIRAAVAAVAVLRARESAMAPLDFPLPPKALLSAWQSVLRSNILNKRGHIR
jgi:Na+-transporting methylmalonyl-CoA/oxaloacetate decarboxylase gamma subunit